MATNEELQRFLAKQLLSREDQQPAGVHFSPWQGAANAGRQIVGAMLAKKANEGEQARTTGIQRTIADALRGPQAPVDGMGPTQDPNEFLINELARNEDTAPMAMDYKLKMMARGLDAENVPSDILSFREVQKMSPSDRELFFQTKRGAQIKEIGGVPSVISGREVTPLSTLEKEAAAGALKEGAKVGAKGAAEQRVAAVGDLPRVEDNAKQTLDLLDRLEQSDLGLIYGAAALVPIVPGTKQADVYSDWEQLQGKAFLEAFNSLKGAGQITEIEGQKATSAITSLSQRRQTPAKAKEAIAQLRAVIKAGVERVRRKAGTPTTVDGGLTPEEQAEYEELKRRFGR